MDLKAFALLLYSCQPTNQKFQATQDSQFSLNLGKFRQINARWQDLRLQVCVA